MKPFDIAHAPHVRPAVLAAARDALMTLPALAADAPAGAVAAARLLLGGRLADLLEQGPLDVHDVRVLFSQAAAYNDGGVPAHEPNPSPLSRALDALAEDLSALPSDTGAPTGIAGARLDDLIFQAAAGAASETVLGQFAERIAVGVDLTEAIFICRVAAAIVMCGDRPIEHAQGEW